jgi:hypothetical protein
MIEKNSYLPAPAMLSLVKMSEPEVAEMIERHIDFVDENGRSVHLSPKFVSHYMKRDDGELPTVVAIAQLPIVLIDGSILAKPRGLDRDRGIVFRIPEELIRLLPKREDCTPDAVYSAFRFLLDDWLCDVSADFTGKCILIAAALTIIERNLLPDRPVFFVTAGRRGGGKTTSLHMLIMAVLGIRAAAAAWSPNEEERRKAILAYFMEALPYLIWDNIPRGAQISCPHIERSCTSAFYADRKLGVSEMVATAASTIHLFTGNNIAPKGDLASRSLKVQLEVDRADPENRTFRHPDPIGWTEAHRGQILAALYTILLGNPELRSPSQHPKTRFKVWWRIIGSAVEHASAQCAGETLDFQKLFLAQEEDDEESASLIDALNALAGQWAGTPVKAADVTAFVNGSSNDLTPDPERQRRQVLREFLAPNAAPGHVVTGKSVGKQLMKHVGEPVSNHCRTLILKVGDDAHAKVKTFWVEARDT